MERRGHCEVSLRGPVGRVAHNGPVCLLAASEVGSSNLLCYLGKVT